MALSLSRKGLRGTVGLDIDGGYIAAIHSHGDRIEAAYSAPLPQGLMVDGEVVDPAGLSAALKDFFAANELPRNVRLGVANQQIVVRQIELPQIDDDKEREMAIRFQAADAIAMPLEDAVLDYQIVGYRDDADGGTRMRVVVVAARSTMVSALVEAAREAGLKPDGIDLDAFALIRALGNDDGADQTARVFCHLAGVTNLAVAVGNSCVYTRPLSAGWEGETEHVAAALADEVRLSIDSYRTLPDAQPIEGLVLSGPGASVPGLAEELAARLGLEGVIASPLGRLDPSALGADEDPNRYTVAAGLAMGASA